MHALTHRLTDFCRGDTDRPHRVRYGLLVRAETGLFAGAAETSADQDRVALDLSSDRP